MITFHGSELCSAPHVGIGLGTSYLSWIDLVERHRPRSSAELLLATCSVSPASRLLHCDEGWTVCLVKQVDVLDDSCEGLPVSLVKHGLVDGRNASIIVHAHLVRLLVN